VNPLLLKVDLPTLFEITESFLRTSSLSAEVFDFLILCLDEIGPGASVLFRSVEFRQLSLAQFKRLKDHRHFEWSYFSTNLGPTISAVRSELIEREQRIEQKANLLRDVVKFGGMEIIDDRPAVRLSPVKPLSGVIGWIALHHLGNIGDVVRVKSNDPVESEDFRPERVCEFENDQQFTSTGDTEQPWICYDFGEYRVIPTHYEIKSAVNIGKDGGHPQSWVFEGSIDEREWTRLDVQNDPNQLNGPGVIAKIEVHADPAEWKFLRLRMTAPNCKDAWWFTFTAWEIYGTLVEAND
jgi:hypothetical protein